MPNREDWWAIYIGTGIMVLLALVVLVVNDVMR